MRGKGGLFKAVAPGILAGISNVDACAVLCLLSIGSAYKYSLLWALILGFLLYAFTLQVASEVALITGKGLAENLRERFGAGELSLTVLTSVAANVSLISAQVAGMAIALAALLGLPLLVAIAASALLLFAVSSTKSLNVIDEVLVALSLTLAAYFILAFKAGANPDAMLAGALSPKLSIEAGYWVAVLAVLGMAVGPNVLFYEACDLAEKGVEESSLVKAMVSAVVGTIVSLAICVAIVTCGASLPSVSEDLSEAVAVFASVFGGASTLLFSLGLFASSLLAAVVTLHSTVALLSEAYGWRGIGIRRDNKAWVAWAAVITLASALPVAFVAKPVKVAVVSSAICSLATIPPLVSMAKMSTDPSIMKGLEAKGAMKALTWIIVGFFVVVNFGGLSLILAERPLLGYVTLPLDLVVIVVVAPLASAVLRKLSLSRRRGMHSEGVWR